MLENKGKEMMMKEKGWWKKRMLYLISIRTYTLPPTAEVKWRLLKRGKPNRKFLSLVGI